MNHAALIGVAALGGALGSAGRCALGMVAGALDLPARVGTLCANTVGCLAAGVLLGCVLRERTADDAWRVFLMTGVLGGLTTFSALSVESVELFHGGRVAHGAAYLCGTIVLGVVCVVAGQAIGRMLG
jgi:CrcB protein